MSSNPYLDVEGWWWADANQYRHGPFATETDAMWGLLDHLEAQRKWRERKDEHARGPDQSDRKKPPS
jgi:hypothetical protein